MGRVWDFLNGASTGAGGCGAESRRKDALATRRSRASPTTVSISRIFYVGCFESASETVGDESLWLKVAMESGLEEIHATCARVRWSHRSSKSGTGHFSELRVGKNVHRCCGRVAGARIARFGERPIAPDACDWAWLARGTPGFFFFFFFSLSLSARARYTVDDDDDDDDDDDESWRTLSTARSYPRSLSR